MSFLSPARWQLALAAFCALLIVPMMQPAVAGDDYPPALQPLIQEGVKIQGQFSAPGHMTAYVGSIRGRPVAMYVTADGNHVVIGTMLDAQGRNLTETEVQSRVMGPQNKAAWKTLEKTDWILDGKKDAPVIVYEFTDPKCPYCHKFRQQAAPWVDAGKVQIRHIVVGILMHDSPAKAATVLGSKDPAAALAYNQTHYSDGGIDVDEKARQRGEAEMKANNRLMRSLGLRGTPSIYYRRADGGIGLKQGLPPRMEEVMGSPRP
jgi:thiol:disulfide interchange protein DsbG